MEKIYENIIELIGNTPLVELKSFGAKHCPKARLVAKLERQNPAGSAKDRVAAAIIRKAKKEGALKEGGMIIEATSGNTGVGISACAAVYGYKAVIVMPENMSMERRKLIAAYGAEIVLTPASEGMKGAVKKAQELHEQNPGSIIAGQFVNDANPTAHYEATGPEIWRDTEGKVAALVAGVGTGGTVSGAGRFLKEQNPDVYVVAVEPATSPLLSGGQAGPHKIQGIGANFIPEVLDREVYDRVMTVDNQDAYDAMAELAKCEGLLCGVSSGAAVIAAARLASQPEYEGKIVVAVLPDTGERYLSLL